MTYYVITNTATVAIDADSLIETQDDPPSLVFKRDGEVIAKFVMWDAWFRDDAVSPLGRDPGPDSTVSH